MEQPNIEEQRLAFGRVAELYDRARPSYPASAIDALMAVAQLHPGAEVLEVGAGTGKATRLLSDRGLLVTALEPDPAMAAVARRSCAGQANVAIEERPFESWSSAKRVQAVVSFQAWHWIDSMVRYERAAEALQDGGWLAVVWTFPEWATMPLCDELRAAYAQAAPTLAPDFPMHPASQPTRLAGDWAEEIAACSRFTAAQVHEYPWTAQYSAASYRALLETHRTTFCCRQTNEHAYCRPSQTQSRPRERSTSTSSLGSAWHDTDESHVHEGSPQASRQPRQGAVMQDDTDMVRLAPLIGEWSVEATFPSATPQPLGQSSPAGRATFEWTLGGQFLQQSVEIPHPEAPDSLAIIGYDPITGAYTQHYFDSRGVARVYAMGFEDGVWSLLREAPDFTPLHFAQRFTGKLSADGRSIAGRWETGDGQTWSHDFDLVYTKVG